MENKKNFIEDIERTLYDIKDKENPINELKERAKSLGIEVEIKK